jgi:pyruvate carboxylase subunit B
MPKVRGDLGYPPLVTPTSQIVGTQAVLNVLMGERYKVIPKEVRDYVRGIYGRPPAPINKQLLVKVLGDDAAVTCRPADLLPPELEMRTKEAEKLGIIKKEEDILTYAIYPQIAPKFLRGEAEEEKLQMAMATAATSGIGVEAHTGLFNKFKVVVDGEAFVVEVEPTGTGEMTVATDAGDAKQAPASAEGGIASNMHGMVLGLKVSKGDAVEEGDVVAVIEAMKMENNIHSPHSGIVREIFVSEGDTVGAGDNLMSVY